MKYNENRKYRLPAYNYTSEGKYFITICAKKRGDDILARVIDEKVQLSVLGRIAESKWLDLPDKFMNVTLNEYIIMPDHIHGIIVLKSIKSHNGKADSKTDNEYYFKSGIANNPMELPNFSLGRIIREFKGAVKYEADKLGYTKFLWQPKFHDRVIRDDTELYFIQNYIQDNPIYWNNEKDKAEDFFIRELKKLERKSL